MSVRQPSPCFAQKPVSSARSPLRAWLLVLLATCAVAWGATGDCQAATLLRINIDGRQHVFDEESQYRMDARPRFESLRLFGMVSQVEHFVGGVNVSISEPFENEPL